MKIETFQIENAICEVYCAGLRLLDGQPEVTRELKEDATVVTALDLEIQKYIETQLGPIFPGYVFIGEEERETEKEKEKKKEKEESRPKGWVIVDPIDGTAPFASGLNYFGISLAVFDEGRQPLLAIMHLPGLRKWYVASFEDQPPVRYQVACSGLVRVSKLEAIPPREMHWRMEDSYIYVGSDAHRRLDLAAYPVKIRALGATVAHLLLLTDSTLDPRLGPVLDPGAVILTRYKLWDVAAGLALAYANGLEIRNLVTGAAYQLKEMFAQPTKTPPALIVGHPEVLRDLDDCVRVRGDRRKRD
jgi:fructose-1,6-bisphosphatase/inositol monophosphatase family enzyme